MSVFENLVTQLLGCQVVIQAQIELSLQYNSRMGHSGVILCSVLFLCSCNKNMFEFKFQHELDGGSLETSNYNNICRRTV